MSEDRRRMERVLAELDELGRSGLPPEEAARLSMDGVVDARILGEMSERRMDAALRAHAATGQKLDFSAVRNNMMGLWMEGFMVGFKFAKKKLGGE